MSETCDVKLEPEESKVCSLSDDTVTQPVVSESYSAGRCESESKIKCEVEEFTDNKSTACSETYALHSADSSHQLIDSSEVREDVKQELLQETSTDQSDYEAGRDSDSISSQSSVEEKFDSKARSQQQEQQTVKLSPVTSTSQSSDDTSRDNRCPLCRKIFSSFQNMKKHIQGQHVTYTGSTDDANTQALAQCSDESSKLTHDTQTLPSHISTVDVAEEPWKCSQCSSYFTRKSGLTRHIRFVHNQEKPHECSACHKKFSTRRICDVHWRSVHSGEKPFSCDRCDYKSSMKGDLTRHQRTVHDRVKRFSCGLCQYKSSSKCDIKQHCKAVHYNQKPQTHN